LQINPTIVSRKDVIRHHKSVGGLVAAVFPIHYPRSLFRAFNILPVEVWGPPAMDTSYGGAHLQPYVCSIVQNALSFLQSGGLGSTDMLVVPHTCDSLQGFGSILLDFVKPKQSVFTPYIPKAKRQSDVDFFAEELRVIYGKLQEITGNSPSDDELRKCILREEETDSLLSQLHQKRRNIPLTDLEFYSIIRSREYLPSEQFTEVANQTLAMTNDTQQSGIPVILSGIVPEPMDALSAITDAGGYVVADDLASCRRRLYPAGKSDDPFTRMAERIVYAPPDSTKGDNIEDRLQYLIDMAKDCGAKGVIFYVVKFCEPELFYLPNLRAGLQAAGIPSTTLEIDINDPFSQQLQTRLEAFLEIL
jgi:benzoyl-CoA reductase/2-hydroxyglutaryl-CoA dehydratase subunit BcrC/BadD/HgdB